MDSMWKKIEDAKPPMTRFNDRNHPDVMGEHQRIIVATKEGTVKETIFTGLGFANIGREEVTHWMLMPENPNRGISGKVSTYDDIKGLKDQYEDEMVRGNDREPVVFDD